MVRENAINITKRTIIAIVLAIAVIMFSRHPIFLTHYCKVLIWTFGLENKS